MENYLAFDFGGTAIKYGVLNQKGDILEKGSFVTPKEDLGKIYEEIDKVYKNTKYKISGLALSLPGAVNSDTGIIAGISAIPCIHGPNIIKDLEDKFSLPVEIENDANCAALAEVWLGEAKDNKDVAFVILGSGIGGALIKDKKLHKGNGLQAGEFGIMYYPKEDGTAGLWGEVSTVRFAKRVSRILGKEIDGKELFRLAEEEKNEIVIKEIDKWYQNIANGLLTIQYVYDPEKIIIGGAISERKELIENINKNVEKVVSQFVEMTVMPNIKRCAFQNDANLKGALYNFLQRRENVSI